MAMSTDQRGQVFEMNLIINLHKTFHICISLFYILERIPLNTFNYENLFNIKNDVKLQK